MSSNYSQATKEKYVGYYIGVESKEQDRYGVGYTEVRYPTIESLTKQLEQNNIYAVLRKIHFDWMVSENSEWCIWKVFMNRETLLEHCYNLEQMNDRIYTINVVKEIHLG